MSGLLAASAVSTACQDSDTGSDAPGRPEPVAGAGNSAAGSTQSAGGSSENSAGGGPSVDALGELDDFLKAEGSGYCARLFRCLESNDDFMGARLLLQDEAGCAAELELVNRRSASIMDLRARMAAGKIRLVPSAAADCIEELSRCNGPDSLDEGSCREAFEGDAQTGEECFRDEDCAGDAYCALESGCPGACQPRKDAGEPCGFPNECAYDGSIVMCDYDALPQPVCRTWQRGPDAAEGDPCTVAPVSAEQVIHCSDGLWCQPLEPGAAAGTCQQALATDAACSDSDDVCANGLCSTTQGSCSTYVALTDVGESCAKEQLRICDPRLGLRCGTDGTCESSGGDGSDSSPCYTGDFQRRCDPGLYCERDGDSDVGVCKPLLPPGSPCTTSSACQSGSCDGACQARYCAH